MAVCCPTFVRRSISRSLSRSSETWTNHKAHNKDYGGRFLQRLGAIWQRGDFTDVTLVVEGEKLRSHRVVLMAFSQYFEALFLAGMKEGDQSEIELKDVPLSDFKTLLNYAYSGDITISSTNVESLLDTASYFGVEYVIDECGKALYGHISIDTCLAIYRLAKIYNMASIMPGTRFFIVTKFRQVMEEEDFLEITEDELTDFLKDDNLLVIIDDVIPKACVQEEAIATAVLRWLNHEPHCHEREKCLATVLKEVRLNLLPKSIVKQLDASLSSTDPKISCKVIPHAATHRSELNKRLQVIRSRTFARGVHQFNSRRVKPIEICADKASLASISAVDIYIRRWDGRRVLGGIRLHYSDGTSQLAGGDSSDFEKESFALDEGERITGIKVNSGWLIDKLKFYTNRGRKFGGYGGDGGGESPLNEPSAGSYGAWVGLKGWVINDQNALSLTDVQFLWLEYTTDAAGPGTPPDRLMVCPPGHPGPLVWSSSYDSNSSNDSE